jgi:purine-nucleoside/S-methyl-5'-thioadenosine phosphorylase / adenosine deaminase
MRPLPVKNRVSNEQLKALDALMADAGLVHSPRQHKSGSARACRFDRAAPDELRTSAPAPQVAANGAEWLPVPQWGKFSWLWHGFSTRRGGFTRVYCPENTPGELNLGFTADDGCEAVLQNRRRFTEAVTGDPAAPLITIRQFHSNVVVSVSAADAAREHPWRADGLMTDSLGLLLGVLTADCVPVLVADRKRRAVAAFHAGWRGTASRIVESGIGRMRLEFGSRPEDLVAAIGPAIGACCYAVGEDVLSAFESQFAYARELFIEVYDADPVRIKYPMLFLTQRAPGHSPIGPALHVDLIEANRRQLLAAGLKPQAIQRIGGCTCCWPALFFSHRGSRGHAGRMMAVIGLCPSRVPDRSR